MSVSTVSSQVSRLGVPFPMLFSAVFSPNMKLAENNAMCLKNEGSTHGGPYGAHSMGPPMRATPPAAVLKVVTYVINDSGAGSRGRSAPGISISGAVH